jgi:hypothetical protein
MKIIRQLHFYLGLFFAPSILFFAFTGALQTFSLHENKEPGSNHPEWIAALAEIHKDQRLPQMKKGASVAITKPIPIEVEPAPQPKKESPPRRKPSVPLKVFVFLMATGLSLTSFLGIYMAFKYNRGRQIIWGLLIAGTGLPILFLYL